MMNRKSFKDGFFRHEKLILLILMIYFINPLGYGNYVGFLLFPVLLNNKAIKTNFDINYLLLLSFSFSYVSIIYQYKGSYVIGLSSMVEYLLFPIMMYSLGKYFQKKYAKEYSFYKIIFSILLFFSLIAFISIAIDIYHSGFNGNRNIPLINYDSKKSTAATLISSSVSLFLAFCGTLLIPARFFEKKYKWIFLVFSVISLIFTIRLGSRTGLGIFILSFMLNYLFFIRYISVKKKLLSSFMLLIILFFALKVSFAGNSEMFSSYEWRVESEEYGNSTVGGRTQLWAKGVENLIKYPMGAAPYFKELSYSHNFWLDIGRVAGVIPMIFMLIFCIRMLYVLLKTIRMRTVSLFKRSVLLSLNIAFLSVSGVEPILEGNFAFLSVYFFFSGVMYAIYKQSYKPPSKIQRIFPEEHSFN